MRIAALLVMFLGSLSLHAETPAPSTAQVEAVLSTHCHRCHGQNGSVEGGFNYVLDLAKLVQRNKIVPGDPARSPLLRRIVNGSMPPAGSHPRPSKAEVELLTKWIASGSRPLFPTASRDPIEPHEVQAFILADLETIDRRSRRFQRYFTLSHLYNSGLSDDELQTYRNALSKLINSLSWHPVIQVPKAIDPAKTILRIDLRNSMWDAVLWNRLLADYPYGLLADTATARAVMVSTGTKMPMVRADWFIATASRAPLYYDLLQLPGNLAELERQLRVDAAVNIQQDRVMRVGFNGSGIARFNRILERHTSVHGAYWRSYDFNEIPQNLIERGSLLADRRNIFAFPLGPGLVETPFTHAGGEAIFSLPNGLHAYYIMNAVNDRLDKAPIAIVSDAKRPDRAVEAGVSCIGCHTTGILPKADQIRDHVEKNPLAFSRADAERIRALYPHKDQSLEVMEDDAKAYSAAIARTGAKVAKTEVISTITRLYEADLDLSAAASEVGLSPESLRLALDSSAILKQNLGALRVAGGTVSRQVWLQTFGDLARDLHLGTLFQVNTIGGVTADNTSEVDPLEAQGNVAHQIVFSANGRRALIASADRSVRYWDVETARDIRRLIGYATSVWSVAFSPDEAQAISGSIDGVVRIWDLETGSELKKLEGHLSLVSAVAFTADGKQAVSGGYDGAVVLWDAATGKELHRLEGEAKYIHAIAPHPTLPLVAVAGDEQVILWNTKTGAVVKKWAAHEGAVTVLRFANEGRVLLCGGDDRMISIWDAAKGTRLLSLKGHDGGIRDLNLIAGGHRLVSASTDRTVRLWNLDTKREVAVFRKHAAPVLAVCGLPSGTRTLSADQDLKQHFWDIQRFGTDTAFTPPLPAPPPDRIPFVK